MTKSCRPDKTTAPADRPTDCPTASPGAKRVVLLPVGPSRVHAYWEFAFRHGPADNNGSSDKPPTAAAPGRTRMVLRFHELEAGPENSFDLDVNAMTGSCYVDVPHPGESYYAELGFRAAKGPFFPAARSGIVSTPAPAPSPIPAVENPRALTEPPPPAAAEPKPPNEPRRTAPQAQARKPAPVKTMPPEADTLEPDEQEEIEPTDNKSLVPVAASPNILALGRTGRLDHDFAEQLTEFQAAGPYALGGQAVSRRAGRLDLSEFCEQRFFPGNSSR